MPAFAAKLKSIPVGLQCFDALLVRWQEEHTACIKPSGGWGAGMVICLGRGEDLQLIPHHSLSRAAVNPDWFYLFGAGSPG